MKKMKKIFSLMLAMVMVFSMTATVFAEDTYSIKIKNANKDHTYEAYQIFAGDLSGSVLSNIEWGTGVTKDGQTALGDAAEKAAALTSVADAKAFAEEVAVYLGTVAGSSSDVTDGAYVISGLEAGYYLVKDKNGTLTGDNETYTSYILQVVGNVEVDPKSSKTTSEKKVIDTNDSTGVTTDLQDSADYDIGDAVPFQIKGTVAADYDKYTVYQFVFHDTEDEGLTFDSSSVVVKVDGTTITTGYEVVTSGLEDGCTFEVRFADLKKITEAIVKAGSVITVDYTSTLNENANLDSSGNKNTMYLEYSNNPYDKQGGEKGKTPVDTVIVFTYKTVVNKVDGEGKALTGAEFTLEKLVDGKWTPITVVKNEEGTTFTFTGLDDGYYRITETTTPAGYNSIDPIYFTVTAEHDALSDDPALTNLAAKQTDEEHEEITDAYTGTVAEFTVVQDEGSISTNVVNNKGTVLPETGGMGTTIFYVVGVVLVLGAGILLVTKRRMSAR